MSCPTQMNSNLVIIWKDTSLLLVSSCGSHCYPFWKESGSVPQNSSYSRPHVPFSFSHLIVRPLERALYLLPRHTSRDYLLKLSLVLEGPSKPHQATAIRSHNYPASPLSPPQIDSPQERQSAKLTQNEDSNCWRRYCRMCRIP